MKRSFLPVLLLAVLMTAVTVDAQTLTVTRNQWNQLTANVTSLQSKVEQLTQRVAKLEQQSNASLANRVTSLEKQVETQRTQMNAALAFMREDKCRYDAAINLLATRPSQLTPDPLTKGCPDATKPARAIPADIPKG